MNKYRCDAVDEMEVEISPDRKSPFDHFVECVYPLRVDSKSNLLLRREKEAIKSSMIATLVSQNVIKQGANDGKQERPSSAMASTRKFNPTPLKTKERSRSLPLREHNHILEKGKSTVFKE